MAKSITFLRDPANLRLIAGVSVVAWLVLRNPTNGTIVDNPNATSVVRIAYFPNVTHAVPLIGVKRGEYQKALGKNCRLEVRVVNAGPEAMEALLAGEVDVAYVGPSPAINTFLKSGGRAIKILAGACSGGASLVIREGVAVRELADLAGKRIAVPQLGGTQDVSCRMFVRKAGLTTKDRGGNVEIIPVKNPDILTLFKRGHLDAAWVPEPWASRLVQEVKAVRLMDERNLWPNGRFATTVLVASTRFATTETGKLDALLRAHLAIVKQLTTKSESNLNDINSELKRLTSKELPEAVLRDAWNHVDISASTYPDSVRAFALAARDIGYLKGSVDITALFDTLPLSRAGYVAPPEPSRTRGGNP